MKGRHKLLILSLIAIISCPLGHILAQQDSIGILENAVDNWELQMDNMEEIEGVTEEFLEKLELMQENRKPNLNNLEYEVAVSQLLLSDYQYYQLQLYIETHGPLYSIFELDVIDGFTVEDRLRLAYRSIVAPPPEPRPTFKQLWRSGKNVLWFRYSQVLEQQAGYDTGRTNHYQGSPARLQFRYDYSNRQHFGFRIAGEKDAGEQFFRGEQKYGFDHYSGSIYVKNIKWLRYAVLGDYRLNFGQGLVLGSSLISGKGSGISALRRFSEGVRAVATTNEGEFFRGGAVTLGNAQWSGSAFAGAVTETNRTAFGGAVSHRRARFSLNGQFVCFGEYADTALSREKWQSLVHPQLWNASLSYQAVAGQHLFFGEVAVNEKGKPAILQTAVFSVTPVFRLATLVRYFATGYLSPMGSGFRSVSGDCGEFGTYLAGHLVLSKNVEADLFCDYYRLQWLSYQTDSPVPGMDAGVSLTVRPSRKSTLYARYYWRNRPKNESEDNYMRRLREQSRHKLRLQWNYEPFPFMRTRTEVSMVFNKGPDSLWRKGILMYQDLVFNLKRPQLSIYLRVAYFDTDSYDERLYTYENDVYYTFTVGSYYYQGMRAYLMLRYKIQNFSIWLRVSRTHYIDRQSISSGLTQIDKPHKTEVKVQGMYRF